MDHYTIEPFDIHWSVRGKAGQGRIQALASALDADLIGAINNHSAGTEKRKAASQAAQMMRQIRKLIEQHNGFQGEQS